MRNSDQLGSSLAKPRRDMRSRGFFLMVIFVAATASAQEWRSFFEGAAFATYVTETGPRKRQNRLFSTNWLVVGVERELGGRGSILGRTRLTLEPLTVPREGYPQLLQYVSAESGGPLVDHQRGHDLVEEVAIGLEWRPLQLYLAPVGEPPLGPEPFAQRISSSDFAEAPFAYDVQESFHVATRVVALGITSHAVDLEYGVFHDAHSTGRHTRIDDGSIDSWSARLTLGPHSRLSAQISAGRLGDAKREVSSASITYNGSVLATSAIWTRGDELSAYGIETTLRSGRSTLMARGESVDRPAGVFNPQQRRTSHVTLGYILDVIRPRSYRAGLGINVDYHTGVRGLRSTYGHKPQSVYMFVRVTRRASP